MNILILIKLLVAHIIGDFFLQTDTICEGKNSKGFRRLTYLAIHSGINAALAYLLVGMWECWLIPVVVFVTHYIIDYVKSCVNSKDTWIFIIDQLAHITVIVLLWAWITDTQLCLSGDWLSDYRIWVVAVCYLLALKPSSILLGTFIAKWTPKENEKNSLPNAGSWIGYLERVLILTFMLVGRTDKGKGSENNGVRNDRHVIKFHHCDFVRCRCSESAGQLTCWLSFLRFLFRFLVLSRNPKEKDYRLFFPLQPRPSKGIPFRLFLLTVYYRSGRPFSLC